MKLKAQSSKLKRSSNLKALPADRECSPVAWNLEILLSFELWILNFQPDGFARA